MLQMQQHYYNKMFCRTGILGLALSEEPEPGLGTPASPAPTGHAAGPESCRENRLLRQRLPAVAAPGGVGPGRG